MKVSTENDNNFGYEKITILVDNIPLNTWIEILKFLKIFENFEIFYLNFKVYLFLF